MNIFIVDGKLHMVMGPSKIKLPLVHWNENIFAVQWPAYESDLESSFALFHNSDLKESEH